MPKSTKKAETVDSTETLADILERIDALEGRYSLLVEGFEWAANQVRPMFGQGALAMVLDGIAEGLKNPKNKRKGQSYDG